MLALRAEIEGAGRPVPAPEKYLDLRTTSARCGSRALSGVAAKPRRCPTGT